MLIVALGTQASGSTWLYNVARSLLQAAHRTVHTVCADDAIDALDQLPLDAMDVVIKAHALDQRLLKLARLAGARILLSTRDPRDSVVSQGERFGLSVEQSLEGLCRTFATIGSLPADLSTLRFAYEDRFTDLPETIARVAQFLGLIVPAASLDAVFAMLRPERVRAGIAERIATSIDGEPPHDPVTQWHLRHIGDGRVGKWRDRLDPADQRVIGACLPTSATPDRVGDGALTWSARLFSRDGALLDRSTVTVASPGRNDTLAYGPYLYLPHGRWRATPLVRAVGRRRALLDADIFLPWAGRSIVSHRARLSRWRGGKAFALEFDHHDHFQPVEARLHGVDGGPGAFTFSGWSLSRMPPA